jgi:MFS transporter, DHA1 family, tetracycline resistance protein
MMMGSNIPFIVHRSSFIVSSISSSCLYSFPMTESGALEYAPPEADPQPPKGAISIIFLIVLMDLFGFGVIIPLLPFYAKEYAASDFQVGLLFSIYSACQLVAAPILGLLSDRFGRRPVLVFSQLGSVAGYLLLGFATHSTWSNPAIGLGLVYLSRIIDGISGGNISTAQAYISDVTSKKDRAKAMGMLGAAFGIGFSLGPFLGGVLGNMNVSYPAFAAALFSLIAAVQTFIRLPESRRHLPTEAESLLHPSRFLPILKAPVLVQLLLISFVSMIAFVMMESTFALFLKDAYVFNPKQVGYFFGFAGVVIITVQGGLIGRLTKRFGEWPLAMVGPAFVCIAMFAYVQASWHKTIALLLLGGLLNASGRSLQMPTLSTLISHESDPKQQGTVFGLFHGLSSLGRVLGPLLATGIYAATRPWPPFAVASSIMGAITIWSVLLRLQSKNRTPAVELTPAA